MGGRIRVVVAESGVAGQDRAAKVAARAMRDAGMEVVYAGPHQTPEQIVDTALQEDADAIGLSGPRLTVFGQVIELLAAQDADDVVVFGGGVPAEDIPKLVELGVARVFTEGTPSAVIVDWLRDTVTARTSQA